MIHLDTHVVVWLYAGAFDKLPPGVHAGLNGTDPVAIAPIVELELQYLFEIGRVARPGADVVRELQARIGLRVADTSYDAVVAEALAIDWTRDPFDRLVVAQARADRATLFTADETIRAHEPRAYWA